MVKLSRLFLAVTLLLQAFIGLAQEKEVLIDSVPSVALDEAVNDAIEAVEAALNESVPKKSTSAVRGLGSSAHVSDVTINDVDTVHLYDTSFSGLHILDSVVGKYSIFMTGENHTYTESNARLWLKMIKYLHAKAGVRNIMFEYGFSYGYLVNEYLQTGDSALFSSIDQFAYDEYSSVIKDLKDFNDSLPETQKLYFAAIDIERGVYPIVKLLDRLLPPQSVEMDDSLYVDVQSLRSLASYNDFQLDKEDDPENQSSRGFMFKTGSSLRLLHHNFLRNEAKFKDYLGANFDLFKRVIISNYNALHQWEEYEENNTVQEYIYREDYMHRRFLEEKSLHPGNWFGQFGRCHTTQELQSNNSCDWFVFNSLANRIKHTKGGLYTNQLLTLTMVYDDDRDFGADKVYAEKMLDKYFYAMPESSLYIVDIRTDSALNVAYGTDFNYLILNTKKERGTAYSYLNASADNSNSDKMKITLGARLQRFDLRNLNQRFSDEGGLELFSEDKTASEFGFLTTDGKFKNATAIGFWFSEDVQIAANTYSLKGFYATSYYLMEMLKEKSWVDIFPGIGMGYSKLKLNTEESYNGTLLLQDGFLGETKLTQYVNDAFTLDATLMADLNLGWFTLGYHTGYCVDVSNKLWKSNKTHLNLSPEVSLGGFYQTLKLGVNF